MDVPPVMVHAAGERPVLLHFFYAKNPPPPGPLAEADIEDEEDLYDWYTFPRALAAAESRQGAPASIGSVRRPPGSQKRGKKDNEF